MVKVKMIKAIGDSLNLEDRINKALEELYAENEEIEIGDIKYQSYYISNPNGGASCHSAMIVYDDGKN